MKTLQGYSHAVDLGDILQSVRKYNMCLNPLKCSFGVRAGKFLSVMLMKRGIGPIPNKCHDVIYMRIHTKSIEVKQLTGFLIALSCVLSCGGNTRLFLFAAQKKKNKASLIFRSEEEG